MATSLNEILGRMQDMSKEAVDHAFLGLLYGPYGTAKTTLAQWLAQSLIDTEAGDRIAYVDSGEGWVSLKNAPALMDDTTRLQFRGYGDLAMLADAIAKGTKSKGVDFGKFKVVVIDEIDSIATDTLDTIVREKHNTKDGEQTPEVEWTDYKPVAALLRQAVRNFQKAGVHVILVAHATLRKDHRGVERTSPSLSPSILKGIAEQIHVMAHTTAEVSGTAKDPKYSRLVQAQPTMLVECKTRVGALNNKVKMSHEEFISAIVDWVSPGGTMAEELAAPEEQVADLIPDELPAEGIPVLDAEEVDDEQFVVND